jgi:hypothetical protein
MVYDLFAEFGEEGMWRRKCMLRRFFVFVNFLIFL